MSDKPTDEAVEAPQDVDLDEGDVVDTIDHTEAVAVRPSIPALVTAVIVVAAIALTLGLLQDLSSIIAPIFLTLNLLIAAFPIYTWLVAKRCPRLVASLVTGLAVFVVLILGLAAIVWSVTKMVQTLSGYTDQFVAMYEQSIAWLGQFGFDESSLLNSLKSISPSSVLDFAGGLVSGTSAASAMIVVIIVMIVFMVMDLPSVGERLRVTQHLHPRFTNSITAFVTGIRRYWLVTTVFGLIVALLDGVVLLILGVSLPLVWIVLAFITNYIPNVGFVIGLVPPALLALFEKGPVTALIVVIAYCVLNFLIQSLIQPKFTGDAVGITPTVSFISLLLWAWVFGALGALIALPATLAVKALLIDSDPRLRWVNAFISNEPEAIAPKPSEG
ncbi:AI-2E family transporter [Tessaracoccus palaemonis]|uniref:AI-2E family transporter n=1 Tax=Tessaracoccus palaemonis TaxID=2829499 RepID=A0ABX8SRK4_9ACTN|nr:AI-2E family transporter [Tessaracoccus palaemonis]QXT63809.1 AI-2E family transporter [Tessaracoccus palaemonis]